MSILDGLNMHFCYFFFFYVPKVPLTSNLVSRVCGFLADKKHNSMNTIYETTMYKIHDRKVNN